MPFSRRLYIPFRSRSTIRVLFRNFISLCVLLLCVSGSPFAPGGLTFLNCNEGSGTTAADLSGNSHPGILTNGPIWTAGKYGQGVEFDGTNDYINIADHADYTLNPTQSYTWSTWVKNNNFNSWGTVWSQTADNNNFFYFYAHTIADPDGGPVTNGISVYWWNNGGTSKLDAHSSDNVLTSGQWSYVSVTYDASQPQNNRFSIYVNGVDVTNRTDVESAGTISSINPTNIRIGSNQPFGEYLNGAVDEVRYYNRMLSIAEIQSDMNTPIDNTAPTVSISSPANASQVNGTINVNANASDNVGVVGVQFLLDGVNLGTEDVNAPYSISWNTNTANDGGHILTAKARDLVGNITTSTGINVTVNNDLIAPTITLTSPAAGMMSGTINVNADAADNIGVVGVQFLLNGVNLGPEDLSQPYSFSWNTTTVTDGQYILAARARDAAGNVTTTSVNLIVHNFPDTQLPAINLTSPSAGIINGTVNINANASDNIGVAGVQFLLNGANLSVEDLNPPYSFSWNTTLVADGHYVLSARARDIDGNTATTVNVNVTVYNLPDNQSPSVILTNPLAGIISGNVDLNATANDNIQVKGVQFLINGVNLGAEDTTAPYSYLWNTTSIADGNYILTARARDLAGNTATTNNITVNVKNDAQAPTVTLTSPSAGTISGTINVTANASDNTGVTGVQFLLNGTNLGVEDLTAPYAISWNTRTISNGSYTLTARARDASGNVQTSSAVTVNVLNLPPDTEYPAIGITSPSAGDVAGVINVTANATDNVGVAGVQFYLNGSDFGAEDLVAPYTFSWNTYGVSNGIYTLSAMARDAAGNIKMSDAVTFSVNNIPDVELPAVSIISPAAGNVTNSITVKANASDNIAVTGVQFFLDGNNLGPEDATSPYTVVWNTATTTAGSHTLSARARDAAGNMSIVTFVNVNVIINNPPVISGVSVNTVTANSVIITWTTNIPSSSQVAYDATTAYTQSTMTDPTLVTSHSMTLIGLAPGTLYHYQVVSGDANGTTRSVDNTFTTANLAASLGSLNLHTVFAYPAGKIVPWTSNPANGYDTVMFLAWKYLLTTVPNDPATGKPAYYSRSYINPNTQQMVDWDHNPAGLYSMLVESAIKYYGYSANASVMQLANDVALWHLDHGMTTSTDSWASVPYSEGQYGSLTYRGAPLADGVGNLEPDKIGELAFAWLQLYKFNGNVRFRDAAIQAANVLASKIRVGTVNQSPWPFRVKASDGSVIEQYCSNIIPPISLFDDLIAEGLGDVSAYQTARTAAWNWMMTFPMQNNVWAQYFEDVAAQSNYNSNLNQLNAMNVATYLLEHPEFDPSWQAHVRGLITWVENTFGQSSFGSTTIREQQVFFFAMGSHTARYASVNAMLYEKTGDLVAKEKAYRSFNWATYMTRNNGVVIDGPEVNNQWFTDGYGDYIRHFMNGLAAVPEWVPANQTRLLRSTSVVRNVSYGINSLSYTTSSATSTEVLHLNFDPALVTVNNVVLPRRSDLNQPGWTLDVATKTIRIYHTTGANITVSAGGAQSICPGESVYFVVPKPGIDYTYQWQVDSTGGNFVNLSNGGIHTGVTTDSLRVNGAPTSFYGNRYRCIVSKNGVPLTGPVYELKFLVKWQGGASNVWEDSSNWSCNNMPDSNTDVLVPGSLTTYPVINTNTAVHSIILSPGSILTVSPGTKLDIKGK